MVVLGPVHKGAQSFHFVQYCSEKGKAEGLGSDGNTQIEHLRSKNWYYQKCDRERNVVRNRSVPFPSEQTKRKYASLRILVSMQGSLQYMLLLLTLLTNTSCKAHSYAPNRTSRSLQAQCFQ